MTIISYIHRILSLIEIYLATNDSKLLKLYLYIINFINSYKNHISTSIVELNNNHALAVFELYAERIGFSYKPNNVESKQFSVSTRVYFPKVNAYHLKNCYVNSACSYPYDKSLNRICVDKFFLNSVEYSSFTSGFLVSHGKKNAILKFKPETKSIKNGIFFGGNGSYNYYHWLIEICSKFLLIDRLPAELQSYPIIVSEKTLKINSFKEVLDVVALKHEVIHIKDECSYLVENIVFLDNLISSPFNINKNKKFTCESFLTRPEAIVYIRETLLKESTQKIEVGFPKKIFLARDSLRSYNQEEIIMIAIKKGFEVVYLEQHSIFRQAQYFANAEVIIGPTGAAWSNLIFATEGARGLCWMPSELGEFSAYSNIAGILKFELKYLFYKSDLSHAGDFYRKYYNLSPSIFKKALELID